MDPTTNTLLLQRVLVLVYPALLLPIIRLSCGFIMRHQNEAAFDVVLNQFLFLLSHISHHVLHNPLTMQLHLGDEDALPVLHHIRSFMSIEIQCFSVLGKTETLTV